MSKEIETKLAEAKDKIDEFRSAISDVTDNHIANRSLSNLADLLAFIGEFIYGEIDNVYNSMDDAVDEIYRLDTENAELNEKIGSLEERITELLPEEDSEK